MNRVSAIVAVDANWGIGKGQDLLIKDKVDQAFFAGFTMGKACLVGYNTLQTLPPLSGRDIIEDGRSYLLGLKELYHNAQIGEVVVIGGAKTYKKYSKQIETLYVTKFSETLDSDKYFDVDLFQHLENRVIVFKGKGFIIERWN